MVGVDSTFFSCFCAHDPLSTTANIIANRAPLAAALETKELPDGYAFRLKSETVSLPDLAEWISAERKCCPFFGFEIELQRDRGPLGLKLKGTE